MKFKDTCLYRTIMIPVDFSEDHCLYSFLLAIPYFALLYTVGIPLALVVDMFIAITNANGDRK